VTALDNCDFDLYPGEVLAVIGDNGAGKSTLIKALCGAVVPDEGEIRLEGQQVQFTNPMQARNAGIETVSGIVTGAGTMALTSGSASVTGVAATAQLGNESVTLSGSVAVTGLSAAGQLGSVTVSLVSLINVAATGVAATGAVGNESVRLSANVPAVGVEATGAVGTADARSSCSAHARLRQLCLAR
jgi:energy-coupling factor transporter ATP-binding protein EcfA2